MLRDAGGNPFGTVLGHEHVILDADADAAIFRRNQQIILAEVQTGLDGENHARANRGSLIGLESSLCAVMHIKTQMVSHTTGEPTTVLLSLQGERLLNAHRQQTPVVQTLGDHAHASVMDVRVGGTRLGSLEAGLLRVQHCLIQALLEVGELAIGREGTGDVGRVQGIDLDAGVHEQHIAVLHHAGVAHPVQDRGVGAGSHDGVVADGVAQLAGDGVERTFEDALGTRLVERGRQGGEQTIKAMLGGIHGLAHLVDLVVILDHTGFGGELVQLVIGGGILVRVGEAVCLTNGFDHRGDLWVGFADHAYTNGSGLGSDILAERVGQLGDVMGFDAGHRLHFLEACARSHPVFAIVCGHEEVLGGVICARSHEQFRRMGLTGSGFGGVRVDRVQHQHGTGFVVGAQARVIGEGGVRAEGVIAIIVAYLRLAGRNDQTLAGECLA